MVHQEILHTVQGPLRNRRVALGDSSIKQNQLNFKANMDSKFLVDTSLLHANTSMTTAVLTAMMKMLPVEG